ncbi:signal transduction histidine kinase/Flp pilus assembly protein TadD [Flavobacterium arsenatis]|uniref:histidine kinase n=1 Tax=Flavobacterium arsenatis TaxID=1484332 RepID=A0ABU1TSJ1_9FLAO|nr:tetratricopeptide repeat-containing sensor histidine kinase [Flavobacterium arsenatis]MDR6968853.1 signal transduction histidine kinase/Flp pilus assembly protein TadD [Flavobacterium arsenatis]
MKHFSISVLLLLCFFFGYAQDKNVNQLLEELKKSTSDTSRLRIYTKLSTTYTFTDAEKKFYYANKSRLLADKLGIDTLVVHGFVDMGISHGLRNNTDSALFYFSTAYVKAKQINHKNGMARALGSIGYAYDRLDNKEEAIKNILQALELYKEIKFKKGINQSYVNLGSLYYDIEQYKVAESYFKLALQTAIEGKEQKGIAHGYFTLGNTYKELKDNKKAREHYSKGLEIAIKIENPSEIALARWGLGQVDAIEKNYNEALKQFQIALKINREIKNEYHKDAVLISIAEAYIQLKDYKKAEPYAMEVYNNALRTNFLVVLSKALPLVIEINKEQRKFEVALEYQTKLMTVIDSLNSEKTTKNVVLADFERIRSENDNLVKDNSQIAAKNTNYVKTIFITSVLLLFVVMLLILYYIRNKEKKAINELLQSQKEEIASVNIELETLNKEIIVQNDELEQLNKVKNKFFSIVSHDLRSPLATLKMLFGLYRRGDLSEAELTELLSQLEDTIYNTAVFLDNLLEWSKSQLDGIVVKPTSFDVKEQVDANIRLLETQINIKQLRIENTIEKPVIAFADKNMINVVIRNLISNAVKFCNPNDSIIVKAETKNDKIVICIRDTGPGIAEKDLDKLFNLEHTITTSNTGEKGHQIGLVLCKDMVEQNNGAIRVESKIGEGTVFCIDLPKI